MFEAIKKRIQNEPAADGAHRHRPKWVLPVAFVLVVLALSLATMYLTSAAGRNYTVWSNSDKPQVINQYDSEPVELGMKFQTKVTGKVVGVKFYKGSKNTGTHTGTLWDKRGKKLAVVTFKNETKTGWQSARFAEPVQISADTTYIISYFAPKGHFSIDSKYFANSGRTNGPLTALKSGVDGTNGVYAYGLGSRFPSDDSNKDNYWVDVIFRAKLTETPPPPVATHPSVKAFDAATPVTDPVWFKKAYDEGFRLYVANVTEGKTCKQSPQAQAELKAATASGLKVAAYTSNPSCWSEAIKATGLYKDQLQFFALNINAAGPAIDRTMVNGIKAAGIRPMVYANASVWSGTQGKTAGDFTDLPLWDTSLAPIKYASWQPDYSSPSPVAYSGWNTASNMRTGVQQAIGYILNGVSVNLSSFDSTFLSASPTKPVPVVATPPAPTQTAPSTPKPTTAPSVGRAYPMHTKINATTFWVGEQFQSTADGSQICSAYDSQWQYSHFQLNTGKNTSVGCKGAPLGGCDALLKTAGGKCDESNSIGSLRTPANGYFPAGLPAVYENPFYLDLPYDDYNQSTSSEKTGYATRCKDVPWANDAGFAGRCTDQSFSYMKNRFVKMMANGNTCYGQIEDAGPADSGNGNGNYADAQYVFGANDPRPFNKSYNSAGMDISPALNSCLGGKFNSDLSLSWSFVDNVDVPAGPWKKVVTTSNPR